MFARRLINEARQSHAIASEIIFIIRWPRIISYATRKKKLARLRNALSRKHAKYATRACVCIHVCVSTYMRARKSSSLVTARDHRPRACSKFVPREVNRGRPKVFRNDYVLTPEFSTSLAYIYGILTCPSFSSAAPDDDVALHGLLHTAMSPRQRETSSSFTQTLAREDRKEDRRWQMNPGRGKV